MPSHVVIVHVMPERFKASEFEAFMLKNEAFACEAYYTKQSNGKSLPVHAVFVVRSLAKDRSSSRAPTEQIQSRGVAKIRRKLR